MKEIKLGRRGFFKAIGAMGAVGVLAPLMARRKEVGELLSEEIWDKFRDVKVGPPEFVSNIFIDPFQINFLGLHPNIRTRHFSLEKTADDLMGYKIRLKDNRNVYGGNISTISSKYIPSDIPLEVDLNYQKDKGFWPGKKLEGIDFEQLPLKQTDFERSFYVLFAPKAREITYSHDEDFSKIPLFLVNFESKFTDKLKSFRKPDLIIPFDKTHSSLVAEFSGGSFRGIRRLGMMVQRGDVSYYSPIENTAREISFICVQENVHIQHAHAREDQSDNLVAVSLKEKKPLLKMGWSTNFGRDLHTNKGSDRVNHVPLYYRFGAVLPEGLSIYGYLNLLNMENKPIYDLNLRIGEAQETIQIQNPFQKKLTSPDINFLNPYEASRSFLNFFLYHSTKGSTNEDLMKNELKRFILERS